MISAIKDFIYNMSLKKKLYLVFGSLIIGTIVGVSLGITAFSRVQVGGPKYSVIEQNMLIADNIAKLRANLAFIRTTLLSLLIEDNNETRNNLREDINALSTRNEELFDIINTQLQTSDHARAIAAMKSAREAWNAFKETRDKELIPLISAGKDKQAMVVARGIQTEHYNAFSAATKEAVDDVRGNVPTMVAEMKLESSLVKWSFVLGSVLIISFYLLVATFFTRTIITPVTMITDRSEYMAKGDFTRVAHAARGTDEIGKMKTNFSIMSNKVRETIVHMKESILNLSSSSEQLWATAETLSKSSGEQARQAKEVTSSVTEMSQTIADVAQNAGQAADAAKRSSETAAAGKDVVEKTAERLVAIMASVKEAMNTIEGLSKSSAQIGEIVTLIHSIADQTNLLALNAAIEAARAGEQGRGFAVVADEVRKLADKTTLATKDIEQKISLVRSEAENSLVTIRKGNDEAEQGVGLARTASDSLESLLKASIHVVDMVQRIAVATEEQSATSEEITRSMNTISGLIDGSHEATEHIQQAARALATMSAETQDTTNWFKTESAEEKG